MESYMTIVEVGQLVENEWTNDRGEKRTIASVEVVLTNGVDQIVTEANDDLARNIAKQVSDGTFDTRAFYRCVMRFSVRTSREKKLKFNSIRLLQLSPILSR